MKNIVAVLLALVLIGGGLGSFAFAQEPANSVFAHFATAWSYNVPGDSFTSGDMEVTGGRVVVGNFAQGGGTVDATNNWWGHASGPSRDNGRVNGKGKVIGKGDSVSENVDRDPRLPQLIGHTKHDSVPPGLS